jgi:Flp pilus assembly protein TadG
VIAWRLARMSRPGKNDHFERGAAAVEMALVSPLLLAMIVGIIDFSRIFNAEIQLSQAAREGARIASLQLGTLDVSAVQARAVLAAPSPAFGGPLPPGNVTVLTSAGQGQPGCLTSPALTDVATVQVTYLFQGIFWMKNVTLSQTAVMRCGG